MSTHTHWTMARLARAMGLELLDGDPAKLITSPHGSRYRFGGAPHGRRVTLELTSHGVASGHGRLAVALVRRVPRFDVCTANRGIQQLLPRLRTPLPQSSFGDGAVDAKWSLRARDARVGPVIARAMTFVPQTLCGWIVCTGEWLQVRSEGVGTLTVLDGERLLYALEELARALEGHAPLSRPPGERQHATSIRCPQCGAPAHEIPGGIHEPITMGCEHCDTHIPAPEALAPAIRAMRAVASHKRWSEGDRALFARHDRANAPVEDVTRAAYVMALGSGGVWLALGGGIHLGTYLVPGAAGFVLGAALGVVAMMIVGVLGLIVLVLHRRVVRERARTSAIADESETPIERATPDFECVECGGTVALANAAIARCAFCGGGNVAESAQLREAADRVRSEGDAAAAQTAVHLDRIWKS